MGMREQREILYLLARTGHSGACRVGAITRMVDLRATSSDTGYITNAACII